MTAAFDATAAPAVVTAGLAGLAAIRGTWSPCGLSMISAINPLSERARGHRYWLTASWFVVGSVLGGAMLGLIGATLAPLFGGLGLGAASIIASLCCLIGLAADNPAVAFRLPRIPRQVNEQWLSGYRRWFYAAGFGVQIGVGLVTYVMTAAVYLVPILGALSGSASFAFAVGLGFGLIRGLAILLTARVRRPGRLLDLHRRLAAAEPWVRWAVLVGEAFAAVMFAWFVDDVAAVIILTAILGGAAHAHRRNGRRQPASRLTATTESASRPPPSRPMDAAPW